MCHQKLNEILKKRINVQSQSLLFLFVVELNYQITLVFSLFRIGFRLHFRNAYCIIYDKKIFSYKFLQRGMNVIFTD